MEKVILEGVYNTGSQKRLGIWTRVCRWNRMHES
jgi:hypothetical protein